MSVGLKISFRFSKTTNFIIILNNALRANCAGSMISVVVFKRILRYIPG